MSMDKTDTVTTYVIKKKDGATAMKITVEYFDLDYEQLMNTTMVHLQALGGMAELGKQEIARRKSSG